MLLSPRSSRRTMSIISGPNRCAGAIIGIGTGTGVIGAGIVGITVTGDGTAIGAVTAEALKLAFSRARPDEGNDPHQWFKGRCCDSFPSGEVTLQASFVTPFIATYGREYPWIWSLELLPAYDALARLKSQDHWQSDVIAGWALGSAIGYWSTTRPVPLSVQVLPKGLSVGFSKRF